MSIAPIFSTSFYGSSSEGSFGPSLLPSYDPLNLSYYFSLDPVYNASYSTYSAHSYASPVTAGVSTSIPSPLNPLAPRFSPALASTLSPLAPAFKPSVASSSNLLAPSTNPLAKSLHPSLALSSGPITGPFITANQPHHAQAPIVTGSNPVLCAERPVDSPSEHPQTPDDCLLELFEYLTQNPESTDDFFARLAEHLAACSTAAAPSSAHAQSGLATHPPAPHTQGSSAEGTVSPAPPIQSDTADAIVSPVTIHAPALDPTLTPSPPTPSPSPSPSPSPASTPTRNRVRNHALAALAASTPASIPAPLLPATPTWTPSEGSGWSSVSPPRGPSSTTAAAAAVVAAAQPAGGRGRPYLYVKADEEAPPLLTYALLDRCTRGAAYSSTPARKRKRSSGSNGGSSKRGRRNSDKDEGEPSARSLGVSSDAE
ncbi:hypothetical protein IAU60_001073 [Kwoniella sp. DSM 27419]